MANTHLSKLSLSLMDSGYPQKFRSERVLSMPPNLWWNMTRRLCPNIHFAGSLRVKMFGGNIPPA